LGITVRFFPSIEGKEYPATTMKGKITSLPLPTPQRHSDPQRFNPI
jgi:hypothetical protein